MEVLIIFIATFIITYLLSYFTMIRKALKKPKEKKERKFFKSKKRKIKKNETGKVPVEVDYLVSIYKIDIKKINYKRFLHLISLVASFDMALSVVIINPIKNIYLQILVGFFVLLPLIYLSYRLVGIYYKKKGMTNNDNERNRK